MTTLEANYQITCSIFWCNKRLYIPFYINCKHVFIHHNYKTTLKTSWSACATQQQSVVEMRSATNLHVAAETRSRSRTLNIHTPHNRPAVHQSSSVTHILDSSERPADADESWIWMRGREMMCCDIKSHCIQEFSHSQNSTTSVFQDWALHIPDTTECVFISQWTLY